MQVVPVPQLSDNYAYLVIDPASGDAAVVDCAEAGPVLAEVTRRGPRLTAVLATHHHYDHVGGNQDLLARLPDLRVYGSADDAPRIPGITDRVVRGETAGPDRPSLCATSGGSWPRQGVPRRRARPARDVDPGMERAWPPASPAPPW